MHLTKFPLFVQSFLDMRSVDPLTSTDTCRFSLRRQFSKDQRVMKPLPNRLLRSQDKKIYRRSHWNTAGNRITRRHESTETWPNYLHGEGLQCPHTCFPFAQNDVLVIAPTVLQVQYTPGCREQRPGCNHTRSRILRIQSMPHGALMDSDMRSAPIAVPSAYLR